MSAPPPIRVLIADDHALLRRGLRFFLQECADLALVGEASGGREAVALAAELRPDVVLMDMVMPDLDGAAATRQIRARAPGTQVIVLTSFLEQELVEKALDAGAIGYLLKDVAGEDLARAIRAARAGLSTLAPQATQALLHAARAHTPANEVGLTPRELEVLALLVEGCANAEIARRLVISVATVKFHVGSILAKLGVSSRTEAVALAWQKKLVG